MAASIGNTSSAANNVSSVSSVTWSHTVESGVSKLIVSGSYIRVTGTITGVTWNGTPLTLGLDAQNGLLQDTAHWYLDNPASGTANIVVTYTDSSTFEPKNGAASAFGLSSGGIGASTTTSAASGAITANITTTQDGSLIVDAVSSGNTDLTTPGAGQTQIWLGNNGAGSQDGASSYKVVSTAGSYTMSWGGGQTWGYSIVEWKAAASTNSSNFFRFV